MFSTLKAKAAGILIGLLLAALLAVAAVTFVPALSFPFSLPFIRRDYTSAHELILRELRPVFTLSTVEYSYKTVFPYDFLPEGIEAGAVMRKSLRGETLSEREEEAARLLALCRRVGIDLDASAYQFVVVQARVRGGFRLADTPWRSPGGQATEGRQSSQSGQAAGGGQPTEGGQQAKDGRRPSLEGIIHIERSSGRVEITLPPPQITAFIIEDETSGEYRYPDIDVTPREWKLITDYVRSTLEQRVIDEGILERSRRNGRRLVRRLLQEAGWKEVHFHEAEAAAEGQK